MKINLESKDNKLTHVGYFLSKHGAVLLFLFFCLFFFKRAFADDLKEDIDNPRRINILIPFYGDLFYLAPIPFVYHKVENKDLDLWHSQLVREAVNAYSTPILEVPDVRHIDDLGSHYEFDAKTWSEKQKTAVGVWHNVPTNRYLDLDAKSVQDLRSLIENHFLEALETLGLGKEHEVCITESWIQFYKDGDYKVLHNHERYGPPYPCNSWAGAYYIYDGDPDPTMPYSGILSFRVRYENYFIRPYSGLLLIWPSDVLHEVHPFYGKSNRIVVNFNISTKK